MRIAAGDWAATLAPECGGAILSLTRGGRDVLRPAPATVADPFDVACFPLVPYANRIADGAFAWQGTAHRLPRNHPRQPHPLHGTGWREAWTVTAQGPAGVAMRLAHAADAHWPWAFEAEQRLSLSPAGLAAELSVRNADDRAMPLSLGFHPYFAKAGADALRFAAEGLWLVDDALLPRAPAPADALGDWATDGSLDRPHLVDHCYTGWDGHARIARDDGDLLLDGEGTPALHVYLPPGEPFFCAEPVTAMPDAVNHAAADTLAPGETRRIAMRITSA